jgi:hypothetical protein
MDIFREEGVLNVSTMLNSYKTDNYEMYEWYPGDEYVDYVGFNTLAPNYGADWFCREAAAHGKPVMMGESSYAINCRDLTFADYVRDYFAAINKYGVCAFQYINWEWSLYPERCGWKDWANGRFTDDSKKVEQYAAALPESAVFRKESDFTPLRLFAECGRRLPEKTGRAERRNEFDGLTAYEDFSYTTTGFDAVYGGFNCFWTKSSVNGESVMRVSYPQKGHFSIGIILNGEPVRIDLPCGGSYEYVFKSGERADVSRLYIINQTS